MGSEEEKIIRSVENVISAVGQLVGDIHGASDIDGRSKAFALERVSSLASDLDQINRALFLNELPENYTEDASAPEGERDLGVVSASVPEFVSEPGLVAEAGTDTSEEEQSEEVVDVLVKPRLVLTPIAAASSAEPDEDVALQSGEERAGADLVQAEVGQADISGREVSDLTLIDGIDEAVLELLHGENIYEYKDIAAFKEVDMLRVSDLLSDPCRVSRQNWIEQAALLAAGGMTRYAMVERGEVFYDRTSWLEAYESSVAFVDGGLVAPIGFVPPVVPSAVGDEASHLIAEASVDEQELTAEQQVELGLSSQEDQGSDNLTVSEQGVEDEYVDDDELTQIILARKQELEDELRQLREKQAWQQKVRDERVKEELVRQGKYSQEQLFQDQAREGQVRYEEAGFGQDNPVEDSSLADSPLADITGLNNDNVGSDGLADQLSRGVYVEESGAQPDFKDQEYRQSVDAFVEELSRSGVMTMEEPEAGVNELVASVGEDGDGLPSDVEAIWHEEVSTAADYVPPVVDDEDEYGAEGEYASDDSYDAGADVFADDGYEESHNEGASDEFSPNGPSRADIFSDEPSVGGLDHQAFADVADISGDEEYNSGDDGLVYANDGADYSESEIAVPQNEVMDPAAKFASGEFALAGRQCQHSEFDHFDHEISTAQQGAQYRAQDGAEVPDNRGAVMSGAGGLENEINEPNRLNGAELTDQDEIRPDVIQGIHFEDGDGVGFSEEEAKSKPLGAFLAKSVKDEGGADSLEQISPNSVSLEPVSLSPVLSAPSMLPAFVSGDEQQQMPENSMAQANGSEFGNSENNLSHNDGMILEGREDRKRMAPPRMAMPDGPPPLHRQNGNLGGQPPGAPHSAHQGRAPGVPMAPPFPPQGMPRPVMPQNGMPLQQAQQQWRGPQGVPPHMMVPPNRLPPQGMMPPPAPGGAENRSDAGLRLAPDGRPVLPEESRRTMVQSQAPHGHLPSVSEPTDQKDEYEGGGAPFSSQISPVGNEPNGIAVPDPMPPRRSRVVRGPELNNQGRSGPDENNSNGAWSNYWGDANGKTDNKETPPKLGFRDKAKKFAQSLQRNFSDDNS